MLVSTRDLDSALKDESMVLVDTRSFKEYSEGHIPGAVHLDLFAFHWADTSEQGLEGFAGQARSLLSMVGAGRAKRVVFYDSVSGMLAARGVWMMACFSRKAEMLDGGIAKWERDGLPLESGQNRYNPCKFEGGLDPAVILGSRGVLGQLGSARIIDARSKGEFDGTIVRAAKPGHIPGAANIDWNKNLRADGTLKDAGGLGELYGPDTGRPVIAYCQGAYRAANTFVALKVLGYEDVRVYLGSWGEWGNDPSLPAEC